MLVGTMLSQLMQLYACHSCCTSDSLIADMSVSTCTDAQGTDKCVLRAYAQYLLLLLQLGC